MVESLARELRQLVTSRSIAALGTLHSGAPWVSMVPYALRPDGSAFLVHVSGLASHTKDMQSDPHVSLLVMESEGAGIPPQALPRVTVSGTAVELPRDSDEYEAGKGLYLARFPDAAPMFDLGDFSLFAITPTSVRWVGGFARAATISPVAFADALRGADQPIA